MRAIVILWVVLFAIIGCGNDQIRNSPPVVDHLIIPDAVSPGDSVELQVVAHDADGDTLTYSWDVQKGFLDSEAHLLPNYKEFLSISETVPLLSEKLLGAGSCSQQYPASSSGF